MTVSASNHTTHTKDTAATSQLVESNFLASLATTSNLIIDPTHTSSITTQIHTSVHLIPSHLFQTDARRLVTISIPHVLMYLLRIARDETERGLSTQITTTAL
jgi:hypothetical protein